MVLKTRNPALLKLPLTVTAGHLMNLKCIDLFSQTDLSYKLNEYAKHRVATNYQEQHFPTLSDSNPFLLEDQSKAQSSRQCLSGPNPLFCHKLSQWQVFIPVKYGDSCRHRPICCCCCSWRSVATPSTKSGTGSPERIMTDLFQIIKVGTTGRRKEISKV